MYAGVVCVQLAAWIALFVADVEAPEAYTGPLSVLLLAISFLVLLGISTLAARGADR